MNIINDFILLEPLTCYCSYEQPIWNFSMFTIDCSICQNGRSVMDMAKDKENQEIIVLLNRQTVVANPNVSHGEIIYVGPV